MPANDRKATDGADLSDVFPEVLPPAPRVSGGMQTGKEDWEAEREKPPAIDAEMLPLAPRVSFEGDAFVDKQGGEDFYQKRPDFEGIGNSPAIPPGVIARISAVPTMPKITVNWTWQTPGYTVVQVRHSAYIVYDDHGRGDRSQTVNVTSGSLQVSFDFGNTILGGTFTATCIVHWRRNNDGAQGDSPSGVFQSSVRADNPSKSVIRSKLADVALQVIAYMESRFCQFDNTSLPLFGPPNGFGVMQLDTPAPTGRQVWDWIDNVGGGITLYQRKKTEVTQHFANIYAAHPDAPKLSAEQLALALYQYYNGGFYWDWNVATRKWQKVGVTAYGDNGMRIEKLVKAGTPPGDWG